MDLAAVEVCSVNLGEHERRLAARLAETLEVPPLACSDAHMIQDVGRFATVFEDPIRSIRDLTKALEKGRFRPFGGLEEEERSVELQR